MLDVAEGLLQTRGFGGVFLDAVAKEVGMTKATIYHHFPMGKEGLILAVALRVMDRHQEGVNQAIASSTVPREQLEAVALWMCSQVGGIEGLLRQSRFFVSESLHAQMFGSFKSSIYRPIEAVFQAGIAAGDFRPHDAEFVTNAFITLITGQPHYGEHRLPAELARDHLEFVMRGIEAKEG